MDWDALARAVVARRTDMGYPTRNAFIAATDLGARTVGDIETGRRPVNASSLARLEKALMWVPGSALKILDGAGPPTVATKDPLAALSLDPRSLERYGDDQELLSVIAEANLTPAENLRVALHLRKRRAEQHAALVRELRDMLGLPAGDG